MCFIQLDPSDQSVYTYFWYTLYMLKTYGFLPLKLNLGLKSSFIWRSITAYVNLPFIGLIFFYIVIYSQAVA